MKSLFRKLGVPAVALAGLMALFTPSPANAKVHFRIGVGVEPAYPVYPYAYPYYGPYYSYPYGYYYGGHWGWGHVHHHHYRYYRR